MHTNYAYNIYREKRGVVNRPDLCVCANRFSKIPGVLCSHSERSEDSV